jgi:hypothetical protein
MGKPRDNDFGSFKFLTGDVNWLDYGGKWIRKVGARRYHVIELINWEDAVGSDADALPTYHVDLSEIDLDEVDPTEALCSSGWFLEIRDGVAVVVNEHDRSEVGHGALTDTLLVEACHGYGARAPIWEQSSNNAREAMRAARRRSRELDKSEAHAEAMDRPINLIGTSALSTSCAASCLRRTSRFPLALIQA